MFGSGHDIGCVKRFARVLTALAFLTPSIAPSYAQGLAGGAASYAGPTAMLGVRIPFGGEGIASSQGIVGLRFGSTWRASPGSTSPQAYRFVPSVEAGFSLRGNPILRLSSFEVRLDQLRASAEGAAQRETFCGRNLSLCIIGGVALAAVLVLALGDWENCTPSDDYPPGQDPCKCYDPYGC
jgi:hypothetical protein